MRVSSASFTLWYLLCVLLFFFFFNDTATTEIYTLSLHDALPISGGYSGVQARVGAHPKPRHARRGDHACQGRGRGASRRSEEHTSELQSHHDLVCRLLLEKKKKNEDSIDETSSHRREAGGPTDTH